MRVLRVCPEMLRDARQKRRDGSEIYRIKRIRKAMETASGTCAPPVPFSPDFSLGPIGASSKSPQAPDFPR